MARASAFLSVVIVAALSVWLLGKLSFLAPYRTAVFHRYGPSILAFIGLFAINLFGLILAINRRVFLRDTGRKLAHIEKQLRTGSSISEELTERITE